MAAGFDPIADTYDSRYDAPEGSSIFHEEVEGLRLVCDNFFGRLRVAFRHQFSRGLNGTWTSMPVDGHPTGITHEREDQEAWYSFKIPFV
jgi:hypothetical protein